LGVRLVEMSEHLVVCRNGAIPVKRYVLQSRDCSDFVGIRSEIAHIGHGINIVTPVRNLQLKRGVLRFLFRGGSFPLFVGHGIVRKVCKRIFFNEFSVHIVQ